MPDDSFSRIFESMILAGCKALVEEFPELLPGRAEARPQRTIKKRRNPKPQRDTPEAQRLTWAAYTLARYGNIEAQEILRDPKAAAKAYRTAAKDLHPDTSHGDKRLMQDLTDAKAVLDTHHGKK